MFSTLFHGNHSVFRVAPRWKVEWNVGGMWKVGCGMWNVACEGCPASSFLMSVLIAGHTIHTVNNVRASYHSQLYMYSRYLPSQRWKVPTLDRPPTRGR